MTERCNHTVGMAWTNDGRYDSVWCSLQADDDGIGWDRDGLKAFNFCPECGASVASEAAGVARKICAWWEDHDKASPPPPPPPPKTAEEIEADRARFAEAIKLLTETTPIAMRFKKDATPSAEYQWPVYQGVRNPRS